ncbi:MAG: RNA polymerase sigma factor [Planctomycetota bacterium]
MSESPFRIDLDILLAQSQWVRRLARSLVLGESQVDDAVQQTWLNVLGHPPRHATGLRAWLATVLRNVVRRRRIVEGRRAGIEQAAATPEAQPSAAAIAQKVELQRHVSGAVLALEEPYRSVVLLRYYEDLPPRDIAERLGVPVETVRTRLKRALTRLRASLDHEYRGSRATWGSIVLGMVEGTSAAPALAASATAGKLVAGGLMMSTDMKITASILVVAGAAFTVWQLRGPEEPAAGPDAPEPTVAAAPLPAVSERGEREEVVPETAAVEGRDLPEPVRRGEDTVAAPAPPEDPFVLEMKGKVNQDNLSRYLKPDQSPVFQNAVLELRDGVLDVDRFADYMATALEGGWVVDGTDRFSTGTEDGKRRVHASGFVAYPTDASKLSYTRAAYNYAEDGSLAGAWTSSYVHPSPIPGLDQNNSKIEVGIGFWADRDDPDRIRGQIELDVSAESGISFQPGDTVAMEAGLRKLEENGKMIDELRDAGRLGKVVYFILGKDRALYGFIPFASGRDVIERGVNQPLSPYARQRLEAMLRRLRELLPGSSR